MLNIGTNESFNPISTKIKLPARQKVLVQIPIKNTHLNEGYIEKVNAGPGIFMGMSLVEKIETTAKCYAINTTSEDIELILPPVDLEDFTLVSPAARSGAYPPLSTEGQKERATRFAKLLKILDFKDLSEEENDNILSILGDYLYQFHLLGDKLGSTNLVSHEIVTTDKKPINQRQYRNPKILKGEIKKPVELLLQNGTVQPSNSPYNSPLRIVPKKPDAQGHKKWRMVIDYRALNERTVSEAYPLPNITDILDQHLEFTRMPFGPKNAPATFQRLMDRVLTGLQGVKLFVYMDDIVVYGCSFEDHAQKLRALVGRLKGAGLSLQPEKCQFLRKEITYLGHVISETRVKPDPRKIEAVKGSPIPKSRKNMKQFLGLTGYYRRFIPEFAKIVKSLNQLLKKEVRFIWSTEQQIAFETLRDKICSQPILQ